MKEKPLVSVLMAAYNREHLIGGSIDSFLRQSYYNIELVICNDCSSDNTEAVIFEYMRKDPRIRYIKNEKNIGFIKTMNQLFSSALGDFVCILDSDDFMADDRIEYQISKITELNADALINEFVKVETDDSVVPHTPRYTHSVKVLANGPDIFYPSGSIMMKKEVLERVGGYHPYFADTFCGDIYFINQIAENFVLYYDPRHVYYYRLTPGSMTQSFSLYKLSKLALVKKLIEQRKKTSTDFLEQGKMQELELLRLELMKDKKWKSEQYRLYAARCLDEKDMTNGINMLKKAFMLNPFSIINYRTLAYLFKK